MKSFIAKIYRLANAPPRCWPVLREIVAPTPRCTKMHRGSALVASNEAAVLPEIALIAASNEFSAGRGSAGTLFVPFGEYPVQVKDRQSGRVVNAVQVWNEEAAEKVMGGLRGLRGAISRLFGAVPVYVGHPDVPELRAQHQDTKAYGRVTGANVEEVDGKKGVGFAVAWNKLGEELVGSGAYMFHSPHWPLEILGAANGVLKTMPIGLRSIGLTNEPNIADSVILGANMDGIQLEEPAAEPPPAPPPSLMQRLVAILGDASVATEDQIVERWMQLIDAAKKVAAAAEARWRAEDAARVSVPNEAPPVDRLVALLDDSLTARTTAANELATLRQTVIDEAASRTRTEADLADVRAQLAAERTARATAEQSLTAANEIGAKFDAAANERGAALDALLDLAIDAGRLPGGRKNDVLAAFNTDFSATLERVRKADRFIPAGSATGNLGRRTRGGQPALEFTSAVNEYMEKHGCGYLAAWSAVKSARPELFSAIG